MADKPDFLRQLEEAEGPGPEEEQQRQAARVAIKGKYRRHGQYLQLTFRLPDNYVEKIEEMDHNHPGLSKEDLKRWLVGVGLEAYAAGRRPEIREQVRERTELPEVD